MSQTPSFPTPPTSPQFGVDAISADDRRRDLEHLKILAILHYVMGGLNALGGCAGIFYIVIGIAIAADPGSMSQNGTAANQQSAAAVGGIMAGFGGCFVIAMWAIAGAVIYAGRCLTTQKNRVFCMIVAGFTCLSVPLGTVLGVFTFIVLARPTVVALFAQKRLGTT